MGSGPTPSPPQLACLPGSGDPSPALPAPGDPVLGTTTIALLGHSLEPVPGVHSQMVRPACPLRPSPRCPLPWQGTGRGAGSGRAAPTYPAPRIVSGTPSWPGASLGRSAVHITDQLCDRDGEAFRSSWGTYRPGVCDLEKQRSEQK